MRFPIALLVALIAGTPHLLHAEAEASLRGSITAMQEQHRIAEEAGLDVYQTAAQIRAATDRGELVPLEGDENYEIAELVSFPYVNAAIRLFVERLGAQYHEACGQKLVVTSGTRPVNEQPANSHALSVHPTGMAVDLRVSDRASCRSWLEETLLSLETKGLLNVTREYRPPHYHLAIFPDQYRSYADSLMAVERTLAEAAERAAMARLAAASSPLAAQRSKPESPSSSLEAGLVFAVGAVLLLTGVGVRRFRRNPGR